MRKVSEIKKLIVSAAIASTMALGILSALPTGNGAETLRAGTAIQVADKGSDGQETHG